jgi:Flp pilus assembly pilin Flp
MMQRFTEKLRTLRDNRLGSVPLQYAIVLTVVSLATVLVAQTVSSKLADKFDAVTSALSRSKL